MISDSAFEEFQILYAFGAIPNDSWIIKTIDEEQELDTLRIVVDSVSMKQINGQELKALHVTYNKLDEYSSMAYTSTILEKIGDIHYMFNWTHYSSNVACDGNYTSGLRCYQDPEFGLYSTGIVDSCDYIYEWVGIHQGDLQNQVRIFPNPAQNFVELSVDRFSEYRAELYDLNGRLLLSTKTFKSNTRIDLSKIGNGLYIIVILENDSKVGYLKMIKN